MKFSKWCLFTFLPIWMLSLWIARPASAQTTCSPTSPAPISGSTGAQGVLDSALWPTGAVSSRINLDTGVMTFFDSTSTPVGTPATLAGASATPPAFPLGLNFISVHLGPGTALAFTTTATGLQPPILPLSCQDVTLDGGSTLTVAPFTGPGPVPAGFPGANGSTQPSLTPAGFGPRSGGLPAASSLYPPIGGGGGNGGAGSSAVPGPAGGGGGPAIVISAAQRVTVNGTINGAGIAAASPAQGGAGGSVRLAGLLIEGIGTINTSGGSGSPDGPIEIQAFLVDGDRFTGTFQTTTTPMRGNLPVQPVPTNLPVISIVQVNTSSPVFQKFGFPNTGSLTTPDVTLPVPSAAQLGVDVSISTSPPGHVPDGTILVVRAVGVDGSAVTANATVAASNAAAHLTLNAGTTYQIVATPSTSFALTSADSNIVASSATLPGAQVSSLPSGTNMRPEPALPALIPARRDEGSLPKGWLPSQSVSGERGVTVASQWMKLFGVSPESYANLAQLGSAQ